MFTRKLLILTLALLLAVATQTQAQNTNDEFFAAARKGDVAAVKAFLDKGVDVNAKTQYGATALSYACDKGHTEVVRLLLERGADPNVKDTFYGATPMSWAAPKGYIEVVKLLIEKGSKEKGEALSAGIEKGSVELVKLILAKGDLSPQVLTKALTNAENAKQTEIAELLKQAGAKPFLKIDEAILKTYLGVYKSEQAGEITFTLNEGKFTGRVTGQNSFTIAAINETTFTIVEFDGVTFIFNKEGDKVTGVTLQQGGGTFAFKRVEK
jgi:ankyrin repeat protein